MISRRDVLRLTSLSVLVLTGASVITGCDAASPSGGAPKDTALQLVSSRAGREPGDPAAIPSVVAALHRFGGGVLGQVSQQGANGNVAVSPYSVGVALALTLNGARGRTLDQLLALFTPADVAALNGGLDALTADVDGLAGPVRRADGSRAELALAAANGLFGQHGERWQQDFLDTLARSYGAGLQTVDYKADAAGATRQINGWTADHTGGRITDIIPADTLNDLTRLVLVNALYLKAPWETPFAPELTRPGRFTRADGSTVAAQMMGLFEPQVLPYATGDGWAAVTLPYAGDGVAMTVVLPDRGRAEAVQADLVAGGLPRYLARRTDTAVDVRLPRWTFRTQTSLADALRSLGVRDAFEDSVADFSGMTTQEPLHVGAVLHQVFVAVDEEGTEAAAATAVVAQASSAMAPAAQLVADRTFFFLVHDSAHDAPLFLGRVDDPVAG